MKSTCIFIVALCLIGLAVADTTKFQSKLTSMLNAKAKSADAVDTVMNLLNDLLASNRKEQADSDAENRTQEAAGLREIEQLTQLRDANRKVLDDAIAHTNFVNTELTDTNNLLSWIRNRRSSIHNKTESLYDQRCYSNSLFIKAIKEHRDALRVLDELKVDLQPYLNNVGLAQITDISSKLQAYAHLFNEKALKEFLELGQEPGKQI